MIKAPDVTFLYTVFAFLIAYAILRKYLFRPLSAILEDRESEERTAAKVHAESLEGLARAIAHAEQELAHARREALREREDLRAQGRSHLEKRLAEARTSATENLEQASHEIGEEASRSSAELPGRIGQLARALAEKILGRELAA
jgi:F-type H+-transporting ATPase subunit b